MAKTRKNEAPDKTNERVGVVLAICPACAVLQGLGYHLPLPCKGERTCQNQELILDGMTLQEMARFEAIMKDYAQRTSYLVHCHRSKRLNEKGS